MKVKELKKLLEDVADDYEVIVNFFDDNAIDEVKIEDHLKMVIIFVD